MEAGNAKKEEMKRGLESRTDRWIYYPSGCFDFIVKTTEMIFAKTLGNVDSLREEQSEKMRKIEELTGSEVFVVGERTSTEKLEEGVIYRRYGIKTVTPETFFSIIDGDFPVEMRRRGGKYRIIDPELLRKKRMEHGLSQAKLAEIVGVSKKTIYVHEKREKPADSALVEMIEKVIGKVSRPIREKKERKPAVSVIDAGLFDIVASQDFSVYIKKYPTEKHINYLREFSEKLEEKTLVVTGRKHEGLATVEPEKFRKMTKEDIFSMFS